MKNVIKILTIILSVALMCGAFLLFVSAADDGSAATGASTEVPVFDDVVLGVGSDQTQKNVTWYSTVNVAGKIDYAPAASMVSGAFPTEYKTADATVKSAMVKTGYYVNHATITGLEENTEYVYRLRAEETVSELYYFNTGSFGDYEFIFAGDPQLSDQTYGNEWADTLKKAISNFSNAKLLISPGDLVDSRQSEVGTAIAEEHWSYFLVDELAEVSFAATVGPGHDVKINDDFASSFGEHFNLPNLSDKYAVTKSLADYWYVYNNTLFMHLNMSDKDAVDGEHKEFIKEAMQQNPNVNWNIVVMHHSLFTTGSHSDPEYEYYEGEIKRYREALAPQLTGLGIDIVLSGHDHIYVRSKLMNGLYVGDDVVENNSVTDPRGTLYVCAGSSTGSKFYESKFSIEDAYYAEKINDEERKSVIRVIVTDTFITISAYFVDGEEPELFDTFTINKTPGVDSPEFVEQPIDAPASTTHVSFVVYAADGSTLVTDGAVEGTDAQGNSVTGYVSHITAFEKVPDGGKIVMVNNYEEGPFPSDTNRHGYTFVKSVTLDLNGYTFASSYNTTTTGDSSQARLKPAAGNGKLFTITGNGTIKVANALTLTDSGNHGNILIDPGKHKAIKFVAIAGYKYSSEGVVSNSSFSNGAGYSIFRMGNAAGVLSANLTIRGNVSFENATTQGSFVGVYGGASVTVENAHLTTDISGWDIINPLFRDCALNTTVARKSPVFTFTNSVIDSPKGVFLRTWNEGGNGEATIANAPKITIDNCQLNFNGNGANRWNDFYIKKDSFVDIRITESKIASDGQYVFYVNSDASMPKAIILLKNTDIDTATYADGDQVVVYSGGTAIIDGGVINMGSNDSGIFYTGYAWTTPQNHDTENGTLPAYADSANANEDYYLGGYGHLIKAGTTYTKEETPGTAGAYSQGASAFIFAEGTEPVDNDNGTFTVNLAEEEAADGPPAATTHVSFVVYAADGTTLITSGAVEGTDAQGNSVTGYVSHITAFNNVPDGGKIVMVNNYEEGPLSTSRNGISFAKSVTLDLNGYTFASSYNTGTSASKCQGARLKPAAGNGKLFTITGNGTIKTATPFVMTDSGNYGNTLVDPGKGNTINFVAIAGYKYSSTGYTANTNFASNDGTVEYAMFKMGNYYSSKAVNLTIRGNVNFKNATPTGSFVGLYGGASLTVENATINAMVTGTDAPLFRDFAFATVTDTTKPQYTEQPYVFTFTNSTINCPTGVFLRTWNYHHADVLDKTDVVVAGTVAGISKVTINNCTLNFNGNGNDRQRDFFPKVDTFIDIRITDSRMFTDSHQVFQINANQKMPKAVIYLKNTDIDTTNNNVAGQILVNYGGTVIIEGGFINMDSSEYIFNSGFAWTTSENHVDSRGDLPYYADPENALYDETIGGYGHLIKAGTKYSQEKIFNTTSAASSYKCEEGCIVKTTTVGDIPCYIVRKPIVTLVSKDGVTIVETYDVSSGGRFNLPVVDNPEVIINEYYKATYNAWMANGTLQESSSITVSDDITLTLIPTVEATFSKLFINVGINDVLGYYFYIPAELVNQEVENVNFLGFRYNNAANYSQKYGEVKDGGVTYARYVKGGYYSSFANAFSLKVEYEVTLYGTTFPITVEFQIPELYYPSTILAENSGFSDETKTHVANLVRFVNEFIRAKDGSYSENVNELYRTYATLCSDYEDGKEEGVADILAKTEMKYEKLKPYLGSISAKVASGRAQYVFEFVENNGVGVKHILITKKGVTEGAGAEANTTIVVSDDDVSDNVHQTMNLKFWNFFGTLNITLTLTDNTTVSGTYDVNTWYDSATMTVDEKQKWASFLYAMKELGDSTYEYRYTPAE